MDGQIIWKNTYRNMPFNSLKYVIPHEQLKFTADKEILMHLIEKLPFHYREILIDAYFLQFSMKEIAELLELPIGTVKSRLYAAKKALRSEVVNYETDHHHKLTFRLPGVLPCALLLAFHARQKLGIRKTDRHLPPKAKRWRWVFRLLY